MPWKNGKGTTTEIFIYPENTKAQNNDFHFRLSSAPIESDSEFSIFPGKQRLLTTIKGAGFKLNNAVYEKFEVATFSGGEKTNCALLKGPVEDFGVIYDPNFFSVQSKILILKSDFAFSLNITNDYFFVVLDGVLRHENILIGPLETLHYSQEASCKLKVNKSAVLFYLSAEKFPG